MDDALEEWIGSTGAAYHMTDSPDCMRVVEPCSMAVKSIQGEGLCCGSMGTLNVVFVDGNQRFSADLHGVIYLPKLGYNLFYPNVEFDGETWNLIVGADGVMTAFGDKLTFHSRGRMVVTTGYRVDEASDALVLPLLPPSDPPHLTKVNMNGFHCMQDHAD